MNCVLSMRIRAADDNLSGAPPSHSNAQVSSNRDTILTSLPFASVIREKIFVTYFERKPLNLANSTQLLLFPWQRNKEYLKGI